MILKYLRDIQLGLSDLILRLRFGGGRKGIKFVDFKVLGLLRVDSQPKGPQRNLAFTMMWVRSEILLRRGLQLLVPSADFAPVN